MRTLIMLCLLYASAAHGQKINDVWILFEGNMIDFTKDPPLPDTVPIELFHDARFINVGNKVTLTDGDNNFLLLSNGSFLWDSTFQLTPNGDNIKGTPIVEGQDYFLAPVAYDNPDHFYLFTIEQKESFRTLYYSLIDLGLHNGLGDIDPSQKNIKLATEPDAILNLLPGSCGEYWLVNRKLGENTFRSYAITKEGVSQEPIVSQFDPAVAEDFNQGISMKSSYNTATSTFFFLDILNFLHSMEFDQQTGVFSNQKRLGGYKASVTNQINLPYYKDFEVSPNGRYVYIIEYHIPVSGEPGDASDLLQLDLRTGETIVLSDHRRDDMRNQYSTLGRAADNKIYLGTVFDEDSALGVIYHPDRKGVDCGLDNEGVLLYRSNFPFPLPYYIDFGAFDSLYVALEDSVAVCGRDYVDIGPSVDYDHYRWQDGSTDRFFRAREDGWYYLTVGRDGCAQGTDSIYVSIQDSILTPDLGEDLSFCRDTAVVLAARQGSTYDRYLWSDGSDAPTLEVDSSGRYILTVFQGGCSVTDTIRVAINELSLDLGPDVAACEGEAVVLRDRSQSSSGGEYRWSTGSIDSSIVVSQSGRYALMVSSDDCVARDSVSVSFGPRPALDLGSDFGVCYGASRILKNLLAQPHTEYLWNGHISGDSIAVDSIGTYRVVASRDGCSSVDSVLVEWASPSECGCIFPLPNILSLSRDDFGPVFRSFPECAQSSFEFFLLDRQGAIRYRTTAGANNQDHASFIRDLSPGVYVYLLELPRTAPKARAGTIVVLE